MRPVTWCSCFDPFSGLVNPTPSAQFHWSTPQNFGWDKRKIQMRKGTPKHGLDNLHWANITIEYQSYRAGTISADQHVWRIQSYWHTGGCVMPRQHLHSNGIISHKHAQSHWQQWQQFNLQTHLEMYALFMHPLVFIPRNHLQRVFYMMAMMTMLYKMLHWI